MVKLRVAALAWAGLTICGIVMFCGRAAAQDYPRVVTDMVEHARAEIRTIDMQSFKASLDGGRAGLVIDVREADEFAGGHIAAAINIPRGVIELKIWKQVGFPERTDLDRRITVYCGSGLRCVLATKSLKDLGFRNAVAVAMSLSDWVNAGYSLVKD
jgi:rhodanese-related sulfurtransferase